MRPRDPRPFRKPGNGKGKTRRVKKDECDIKLGKSALSRSRGQIQADSREVIHTLMEDSEFSSFSRGTGRLILEKPRGKGSNVRHLTTSEQERASGSPGT